MPPHAENDVVAAIDTKGAKADAPALEEPSSSSQAQSQSLKSVRHLKSYPIVADGINTFTAHPIGQRTVSLSASVYSRLVGPLSPYLTYAYPYVHRADDFADESLGRIESRFPIVKQPTDLVKTAVINSVAYPRRLAADAIGRGHDFAREKQQHVCKVYEDEFSKISGGNANSSANANGAAAGADGYIPLAKAGITSAFVVSSELMGAIASYLGSKKDAAKEEVVPPAAADSKQ